MLSHLKPHKGIKKPTLAGWVKIVLKKAGIDTSQLKAHLCRSATTSNAKAMGISLEGVVHSFWWRPFLLVEATVFINFMVFEDQLIAISEYLYTPCVDQV